MAFKLIDLLQFYSPKSRPSIVMAKRTLEGFLSEEQTELAEPDSILNGYNDGGYVASFEEIEEWVSRNTAEAAEHLTGQALEIEEALSDANGELAKEQVKAAERFLANEIDEDAFIEEIATLWAWMDDSPFWSGSPDHPFWHVMKAQAALLDVGRSKCASIDARADIRKILIAFEVQRAQALLAGKAEVPKLEVLDAKLAIVEEKLSATEKSENDLIQSAIRLGFLFRDAWWIREHADISLKGYLAKRTEARAGKGGGARASEDKAARIAVFLCEHAKLIRDNPALRNDPDGALAERAIKQATKKNPKLFSRGKSKKAAVEYWEYIRSDAELWEKYEKLAYKTKG